MKSQTCCFTGHRNIPHEKTQTIREKLEKELVKLIQQGYKYFGAGGALGFDTLAAQVVLQLKNKFPQIKLILVLPCLTQSKNWSKKDQIIYEQIKEQADKIVYTSNEYIRGCMHKRNRHLVNNSSLCICYLNKSTGGTAYTVDYAKKSGLAVINIAEV